MPPPPPWRVLADEGIGIVPAAGPERGEMSEERRGSPPLVVDVLGAYPPAVAVVEALVVLEVLEAYPPAVPVVAVGSPLEAAMRCWDVSSAFVSPAYHYPNESINSVDRKSVV
mgnify:FL=1